MEILNGAEPPSMGCRPVLWEESNPLSTGFADPTETREVLWPPVFPFVGNLPDTLDVGHTWRHLPLICQLCVAPGMKQVNHAESVFTAPLCRPSEERILCL